MTRDSSAQRLAGAHPRTRRRFRMASRRDAVAPMVDRVLFAIDPVGLTEDQREDAAVALSEALSNAAVHGNRLRPDAIVRIAVTVESGVCATVEIADSGPGFDVASVHDPTDPARLLATGGRGVFMMRRLVDDLSYNARGNKVRLTVRAR